MERKRFGLRQMAILEFTINLPPRSKKNHSQIVMTGKYPRLIPSKPYREYQDNCKWFMPKTEPIDSPVNVKALFYMDTHRRVDINNLLAALMDICVYYGVLVDDNSKIVVSVDGSRVLYDKDNPRTEVTITEVEEEKICPTSQWI